MKRLFLYILVMVTAFSAMQSCTDFKEEEINVNFGVDVEAIDFSFAPSAYAIKVSSGSRWDVIGMPEWISIQSINRSPSSKYEWVVSFLVAANDDFDREGTILFKSNNQTSSVFVKQKGKRGQFISVESISLEKHSMTLPVGSNEKLLALIIPDNASNHSVEWSSSNSAVASVDSEGVVTAVATGFASITVTSKDGWKNDQCHIVVVDGIENGYGWIDLDLPSGNKWALQNVGASTITDKGNLYAWGETETKAEFTQENYKWPNYEKYNQSDGKISLDKEDDVAASWGKNWKMPSELDFVELKKYCTLSLTKFKGVDVIQVMSNSNGKVIYLPVEMYVSQSYPQYGETPVGRYWSSTRGNDGTYVTVSIPRHFYAVGMTSGLAVMSRVFYADIDYTGRSSGRLVRPIYRIVVTSVSLSPSYLQLTVGESSTINVTISPTNATDKSVIWSSSNTSVASVSTSGVVTAISPGTANISVLTNDGIKATCPVTVNAGGDNGVENGHDYVDLGLPSGLKWATCNVGASTPEDCGYYFAWGETSTKSDYSWTNYKYRISGDHESNITFSKYNSNSNRGTVDNKTTLDLSDDAARANWRGNGRMPTKADFEELKSNCTYTWTTQSGVNGYLMTSKKNNRSIFLPAAGRWYESSLDDVGVNGSYWTSSLYSAYQYPFYAYFLLFNLSYVTSNYHYRCQGRSVRPVFAE